MMKSSAVLILAVFAALIQTATAIEHTMTIPAGLSIIANPLYGPDDSLNNVLELSDLDIGTTIFRFDEITQGFGEPIQWAGTSLKWLSANPDPSWAVLTPGEAVFIQTFSETTVTWSGDEACGNLSNELPGLGELALRSSQVFEAAQIGSSGVGLQFPSETADTLYIYDNASGAYKEPYSYLELFGGWFSANPDDEGFDGPTIPLGTGFWIRSAQPRSWDRSYATPACAGSVPVPEPATEVLVALALFALLRFRRSRNCSVA